MPLIGHKKSRLGCVRCKHRRVKCDQSVPCRNCVRRGEDCSLLQRPGDSKSCPHVLDYDYPATWGLDLYLMHHYSLHTSLTISQNQEIQSFWQSWAPAEAMTHSFLMHQLLALSASHVAYLRPDEASLHMEISRGHQSVALESFRRTLPFITEHNCSAAFAVATLIAVQSMALATLGITPRLASHGETQHNMTLDDLIQLIVLARGVRDVLTPEWNSLAQGPARVLFQETRRRSPVDLPANLQLRFNQLKNGLHGMLHGSKPQPQAVILSCLDTSSKLEECYRDIIGRLRDGSALEMGIIWKWVALVPSEYITYVQDRHPPALIVLAHFVVISLLWWRHWYVQHWGSHCVDAIQQELGPAWSEWLRWPANQTPESVSGFGDAQY